MRCLSSEFGIRIAIEARVECDDALITGKSQLIGGRAERGARDVGDVGVWYDDNWRHKPESIMETMPHCCRCPGRKQSLPICSNSNSKFNSDFDADSHCESNCDYPQSLSQSTVLRYYCCYFCPCFPCCCCCCCCYPCYPCCCPVADCAAIVFKNEIKMVLAIADSLEWWRHTDMGWGRGVVRHPLATLHPASLSPRTPLLCLVLGNKSRKNCGLQSRISIAQLFIIASAFPPGALCSAFPLLLSALLFFFR